jgi:hypothetical protein
MDITELFDIYKEVQQLADTFDTNMAVKRTWINTLQRNGSRKWRPLGISS